MSITSEANSITDALRAPSKLTDEVVIALAGALCLDVTYGSGASSSCEIVTRIPFAVIGAAQFDLSDLLAVHIGKLLPKGARTLSSEVFGEMGEDAVTYRCRVW